jgi:hypothetical protein
MFRRADLCPGPTECPYATGEDRCDECPLTRLDEYLGSSSGQMMSQAIDLDFALQAGVTVTLAEISYPVFLLLRLLHEERNRFQEEAMKRSSRGR